MDIKDKKYDAFISYRHSNLDKFVAETLQKALERFKIPKQVLKSRRDKKESIGDKEKSICVFRDQDELPLASNLADPITEALKNSEFLIVICTPRLPESQWCKREIETFIQLHGRERIFTVLAEGEPAESFPEELLYEQIEELDDAGNKTIRTRQVEPLAADVRGASFKEVKKKIKSEKLRLMAPMLGLGYDDLKQRNKEHKMKQALTMSAVVALVLLIFCTISTTMAVQIQQQSNKISSQNEQITQQNKDITEKNNDITEKNIEIMKQSDQIQQQYEEAQKNYSKSLADASNRILESGDRMAAIYTARKGMPATLIHPEIPYTQECENALTDAMYVYEDYNTFLPSSVYNADSNITNFQLSEDGTLLIGIDSTNQIYVWDTQTNLLRFKVQGSSGTSINNVCFLGKDKLLCNSEGFCCYELDSGERKELGREVSVIHPYPDKKHYLVVTYDSITCMNENFTFDFQQKSDVFLSISAEDVAITEDNSKIILLNSAPNNECFMIIDAKSGEILHQQRLSFYFAYLSYGNGKLLIAATQRVDEITFNANLMCYDTNSLNLLWEWSEDEIWYHTVKYISYDNQEYFYLFNSQRIMVLNANTGDKIDSNKQEKHIVNSCLLNDKKSEVIMYTDGAMDTYDIITGEMFDISDRLDYSKYTIQDFVWKNGIFYIQPAQTNQILKYEMQEVDETSIIAKLDASCNMGTLNQDGTLFLEQGDNSIILKATNTDTIIAKVDCKYSNAKYCFVGDGLEEFSVTGENSCSVYSSRDGKVIREIQTFSGDSCNLKYSHSGKMLFVHNYSKESDTVYSLETGEIIITIPEFEKNQYTNVLFCENQSIFAYYPSSRDMIRLYHTGDEQPYVTKEISFRDAKNILFTGDGKYLCIVGGNGNPTFYSTDTLNLVKTIYDLDIGYDQQIDYLDSIHRYAIIVYSGAYLLDDDLCQTGSITDYHSFDDKARSFITKHNARVYKLPYYSYEELIHAADEKLNGYTLPEELKKRYNVE